MKISVSLIIIVIKRIQRQQYVIEVHVNTLHHKYYMFISFNSKYFQYLYKNFLNRSVVEKGGMDEYAMKYTYQINENVWLDREFEPGTPA